MRLVEETEKTYFVTFVNRQGGSATVQAYTKAEAIERVHASECDFGDPFPMNTEILEVCESKTEPQGAAHDAE